MQEEISVQFEMKDITKDSFTASYKKEKSASTTNTYTTKVSDTVTTQAGLQCGCPKNIPDNTYCDFRFTYKSSSSWASVRWNGQ